GGGGAAGGGAGGGAAAAGGPRGGGGGGRGLASAGGAGEDGPPLQGGPLAVLCADGSLHALAPAGGAVGFHALPPLGDGRLVEMTRSPTTMAVAAERGAGVLAGLGRPRPRGQDAPGPGPGPRGGAA